MKLFPVLTALVIASGLVGCATSTVDDAATPMVPMTSMSPIDDTYVEVCEPFTFLPSLTGYTFPVGRYVSVKRENGGVFYESPAGIKVRTLGGSYVVKGGIFRGDPSARTKSAVYVYVYMPLVGMQMVPLHSMIGLDLNQKLRWVPALSP